MIIALVVMFVKAHYPEQFEKGIQLCKNYLVR